MFQPSYLMQSQVCLLSSVVLEGSGKNGYQFRIQRKPLRISTRVTINFRHFSEPNICVKTNSYVRNIRVSGKKTKVQQEVFSYEYFIWREKFGEKDLPDWWSVTNDLSVKDHISIQSVVQKWCDSSVSKTANVPTDYSFEDFKKIYFGGWKSGLKGVTTFRFNPEVFSGVIVRKEDLESTEYSFELEDGTSVVVKGSDVIEYDGEQHNAANLFDALKESMYGDM